MLIISSYLDKKFRATDFYIKTALNKFCSKFKKYLVLIRPAWLVYEHAVLEIPIVYLSHLLCVPFPPSPDSLSRINNELLWFTTVKKYTTHDLHFKCVNKIVCSDGSQGALVLKRLTSLMVTCTVWFICSDVLVKGDLGCESLALVWGWEVCRACEGWANQICSRALVSKQGVKVLWECPDVTVSVSRDPPPPPLDIFWNALYDIQSSN